MSKKSVFNIQEGKQSRKHFQQSLFSAQTNCLSTNSERLSVRVYWNNSSLFFKLINKDTMPYTLARHHSFFLCVFS